MTDENPLRAIDPPDDLVRAISRGRRPLFEGGKVAIAPRPAADAHSIMQVINQLRPCD